MVDQATANMVMRDIMGYDIPGGEQKSDSSKSVDESAETIEVTDDKLVKLIEGRDQPGISSNCVMKYLKLKEEIDNGELEQELTKPVNINTMIGDMLGSM